MVHMHTFVLFSLPEDTIENTTGINVEGNLDLRNTMGHRQDAREFEFTEQVVVLYPCILTFIHILR